MDITFNIGKDKFNYRVCAVITNNNKILAMKDGRAPYFYLPGGRVMMGETAENAIIRELKEELGITAEIIRPLYLNQAFFKEDVNGLNYHEICLYFLMDISHSDLLLKEEKFSIHEGENQIIFQWLDFERLKDEYFYPQFLKETIFDLPEVFTILIEKE
jgi:ADP-ribose pyrophosphatase YjhB (NUDIX family)